MAELPSDMLGEVFGHVADMPGTLAINRLVCGAFRNHLSPSRIQEAHDQAWAALASEEDKKKNKDKAPEARLFGGFNLFDSEGNFDLGVRRRRT